MRPGQWQEAVVAGVKKQAAESNGLGPKPELRWIKLTQLYMPTEYQRSVKSDASAKNINYIKANFNWAEFGALIVCPLAGSNPPQFAVMDGQHRFRAAEARGDISDLPCVVIGDREAKEQASSFVVINSKRVKLHSLQAYHAAVVAGDPDAVALADILKKCKVEVANMAISLKSTHPRMTCAVGSLLKMIGEYSEKQIVWVLTIIPEAYGDEKGMLRPNLIRTLANFIKEKPDTDRAAMIHALQEIDVDELEKDARGHRKIQGGTMANAMLTVIERKYNAAKKAVA